MKKIIMTLAQLCELPEGAEFALDGYVFTVLRQEGSHTVARANRMDPAKGYVKLYFDADEIVVWHKPVEEDAPETGTVRSLNEAYADETIEYRCNATGDVFDADNEDRLLINEAEILESSGMTAQEWELYHDYWTEDAGANMYVLRLFDRDKTLGSDACKTRNAMGLGYLVDTGWCEDILTRRKLAAKLTRKEVESQYMPLMWRALHNAAEAFIAGIVPGCEVYIGNDTDPDGHELLVAVPYEMRANIREVASKLNASAYDAIEEVFVGLVKARNKTLQPTGYKAFDIEWDTDGKYIPLPMEIDIPEGMTDLDDISDYLSDMTGYCHNGFRLKKTY